MNKLSKLFILAISIACLCVSCADDEVLMEPGSVKQPTALLSGMQLDLSPDLRELVTPVITYYQKDGVHEVVVSDNMYEMATNEKLGTDVAYRFKQDSLMICVTDSAFIKLHYLPKKNAAFDNEKKYTLSREFAMISYDYVNTSEVVIDKEKYYVRFYDTKLNVGPSEDGKYSAEQAQEYVKELCSKPLYVNLVLIPAAED